MDKTECDQCGGLYKNLNEHISRVHNNGTCIECGITLQGDLSSWVKHFRSARHANNSTFEFHSESESELPFLSSPTPGDELLHTPEELNENSPLNLDGVSSSSFFGDSDFHISQPVLQNDLLPPNPPPEMTSSAILFCELQLKHTLSSAVMKDIFSVITSQGFSTGDLGSSFDKISKDHKAKVPPLYFHHVVTPQGEVIKVNSIVTLLFSLLLNPDFVKQLDFEVPQEGYSNIQSGEWYKRNCVPGERLLALQIFYDPWVASAQNSVGSVYLSIGNLVPNVFFFTQHILQGDKQLDPFIPQIL